MMDDYRIGRVVAVDAAQVTVALESDLKSFTRSTIEGTKDAGHINSYVVIPVGGHRNVAIVTRLYVKEDGSATAAGNTVHLPSARKMLRGVMTGVVEEGIYQQGISSHPVLDSPVLMPTQQDLDAIFQRAIEPGFPLGGDSHLSIGRSAVFPEYAINIDVDAFFGMHAAVLGSTGSGKSCTISSIIQAILHTPAVKQTRFIIFDTHGEYRSAFQRRSPQGSWTDVHESYKTLYIPTAADASDKLAIPYWFMNADDFVRLFRASPGVQQPVLLEALTAARESGESPTWVKLREDLRIECQRMMTAAREGRWQERNTIDVLCKGIVSYLQDPGNAGALGELLSHYPTILQEEVVETLHELRKKVRRRSDRDYDPLTMALRQEVNQVAQSLIMELAGVPQLTGHRGAASVDSPRFFSKSDFRDLYLEDALASSEAYSPRTRDYCSTMLLRIYRLLADSRFDFLFGPTDSEWPQVEHALATFLRDILGASSRDNDHSIGTCTLSPEVFPFYKRQRQGSSGSNVVIVDLSLLATEALENVTALLGRLIHEFLQRLSDPISGVERGDYPVVLILDEAHNYIRETGRAEEDSISKEIFERIAREGRKCGLGLVIASQRPSELSRTVLAQCNSFIVHRLQNPADLHYFRAIVPNIYSELLDQLPTLPSRTALVLGQCIQIPSLALIREAYPVPQSINPQMYKSWVEEEKVPNFEEICAKWEGRVFARRDSAGEKMRGGYSDYEDPF